MLESLQMPRSNVRHIWVYMLALVGYALISVLFFWSLIAGFGEVVPGAVRTDYDHFIWNYWWIDHALQNGLDPLQSDFMLFPNTHNLTLHTLTPIWLPLWMLIEPFVERIGFLTLALVLSTLLTALATFAWIKPMLSRSAFGVSMAFALGVFFAFQPYVRFSASNSHLNIISLWWIPLTLSLWREVAFTRIFKRPISALLLGLAFWGCWLTDYGLWLSLPIVLGVYGVWTLWHLRQNFRWVKPMLWGIFALAIMGIGVVLIYPSSAFFAVDTSNPYVYPPSSLESIRELALSSSSWFGLDFDPENKRVGTVLAVTFWGSLVGIGVTVLRQRSMPRYQTSGDYPNPPHWLWLLMSLPLALLMLGVDIQLGDTRVALPYRFLHEALNGQYRTPERFVLPLTFVLVTFVALVLDYLLTRLSEQTKRRLAILPLIAGALMLVETGILEPFPTRNITDYPIYDTIGQDERDYVILDVPIGVHYGWTGMGAGRYSIIYTPLHQKRTVNGFLARIPFSDYAYYTDSPFFTWLAQDYPRSQEQMVQINAEFDQYLVSYPMGYVFAHRQWMTDDQMTHWIGWLNERDGLCVPQISHDTQVIWWRAEAFDCDETPATMTIDLGGGADWVYIGSGWFNPENIGGPMARWAGERVTLRVNPPQSERMEITFTATAFDRARTVIIGDQTVTITADGWNTYTIIVPISALNNNLLTLTHESADSAMSLGLSADERAIAVAYAEFTISASE